MGSDADIVIVDLKKRKTIKSKELWSKFSPYEGMECIGWPVLTMLRGKVIFQEDKIVGEPQGQYVPICPNLDE